MTKWALEVTITCAAAAREAANKFLEQLGYGPNNINTQLKNKNWVTTLPATEAMLADIKELADKHPKLNIKITNRNKANPIAITKCVANAKEKFDKADYQSSSAARTKAKVDVTALASAKIQKEK